MADIELKNIFKQYLGVDVLRDFSLTIRQGDTLAFMGPSGSGKTTLMRIVTGVEKPDAGQIAGAELLRFAFVFQENRLCAGLSALQNVALVLPRAKWSEIPAALAQLGLEKEDVFKPVSQLSGGQKRRVALARAVMASSDVLVLDEPFKGLDTVTRQTAFNYVRQHLDGRTMLLVTHDEEEAQQCARRVTLTAG
ncbi:MAG: ATP-binding cassette domain-containing protein [Oscillospiraceae bacterium]